MGKISEYIGQHCNDQNRGYKDSAQGPRPAHTEDAAVKHNTTSSTPYRSEDGQHYSDSHYTPGQESGQKSSMRHPIGMKSGGETAHEMMYPLNGKERMKDISTTTGGAPLLGRQEGNK